jgi:hypothetical protein
VQAEVAEVAREQLLRGHVVDGDREEALIWPACRSIVSTRSTPASWSMSATRRAEIGSRGFALRSCREYGNHGTSAVIRFAGRELAA